MDASGSGNRRIRRRAEGCQAAGLPGGPVSGRPSARSGRRPCRRRTARRPRTSTGRCAADRGSSRHVPSAWASRPFTTGEISRLMPGYGPDATTRYGHTHHDTRPSIAPSSSRPAPAATGWLRPRRPNGAPSEARHALDQQLAAALEDQLDRELEDDSTRNSSTTALLHQLDRPPRAHRRDVGADQALVPAGPIAATPNTQSSIETPGSTTSVTLPTVRACCQS